MKSIKIILLTLAVIFAFACDRVDLEDVTFDNVIYLSNASSNDTDNLTFRATDESATRTIEVALALPASQNVKAKLKVDMSLVASYGRANYIDNALPLPENVYSLSTTEVEILAGDVRSTPVVVTFENLTEVEPDMTCVLPITIESNDGGVKFLEGSRTIYIVVKQGAIIVTAAYIDGVKLEVEGFSGSGGSVVNGLTELTMEGLFFLNSAEGLNTLMGIEQYFLLRLGDTGYDPAQLQVATSGGSFPSADANKVFSKNEWHHFAVTYNGSTKEIEIYADGRIQSTGTVSGPSTVNFNVANGDWPFLIGYSYDDERFLDGNVSEFRIWNLIRTAEEIEEHMYEVDPETPGLVSYWKFDEGGGSTIKDYANGNDATAANGYASVRWVSVSLP
ncbi:MAG: DUF1735 and LamG domain-containing protein [Rikenellaceae bacterium]|nr:DUF1735 and LamG domain-containing protein [Rikenellaceae bacterium]